MSDHRGLGGGRFRTYPPSSNGFMIVPSHGTGPGSIPGGGILIRIYYIHIKEQQN
jgi:hypothetical protein